MMQSRAQKELKRTMGHPASVGTLQPCAFAAPVADTRHPVENIDGSVGGSGM